MEAKSLPYSTTKNAQKLIEIRFLCSYLRSHKCIPSALATGVQPIRSCLRSPPLERRYVFYMVNLSFPGAFTTLLAERRSESTRFLTPSVVLVVALVPVVDAVGASSYG
uniref:Uncharacterized protein n=1 Tax=Steinernema glaseri TaxID=37863 RepID=A0A1I8A404_9BILA